MTGLEKATQIEEASQEYLKMIRGKGYDMEYRKRLAWIVARRHKIENKEFFKELICHNTNYDIARYNIEKSERQKKRCKLCGRKTEAKHS